MTSHRRKLVIDCDPGNDDAMAIFLALSDPDVDLLAVTCVDGNTVVKQTALNALRVLEVAGRSEIPVFVDCDMPLLGDRKPRSVGYHGDDGLGDVIDDKAPGEDKLQTEHAVQALVRLSKEHKGELELVAIGPLTNVAVAIRMDSEFGTRLKSCYIMGGNNIGKGNISVAAKFNFYADPEAANVVLNQLRSPITMVPWETCMDHAISWETFTKMREENSEKARFMKAVDQHSVDYAHAMGSREFIPADETTMTCFLCHDVIKTSVNVYATVETKGEHTWGQVVVDWQGILKKPTNVTIVTKLDQSIYQDLMSKALSEHGIKLGCRI